MEKHKYHLLQHNKNLLVTLKSQIHHSIFLKLLRIHPQPLLHKLALRNLPRLQLGPLNDGTPRPGFVPPAEQHAQEHFEDVSEEQIEATFRTNIFGQMFMVQAALPHLKQGASIIGITSVTAYRGQDLLIDYSATKGAILSFIRALASKLADRGIRVNGVAPGPIWTPLIPASFPPDKVGSFGQGTKLGRPGQPNEVAPSVLFLACEDGSYMTGHVLHPDGGASVAD